MFLESLSNLTLESFSVRESVSMNFDVLSPRVGFVSILDGH